MGRGHVEKIVEHRRRVRQQVVERAKGWARSLPGPATVVLYGSYARGDFNEWSDVDILLIAPWLSGRGVLERLRSIDAPPGYEVVAWTPQELEAMTAKCNPVTVDAGLHGVVLRDDLGLAEKLRRAAEKCRRALRDRRLV